MRNKMTDVRVEPLATYRRFCVERVTQRISDTLEHSRDIVRHPGSVVLIPHVDDDHLSLIHI